MQLGTEGQPEHRKILNNLNDSPSFALITLLSYGIPAANYAPPMLIRSSLVMLDLGSLSGAQRIVNVAV